MTGHIRQHQGGHDVRTKRLRDAFATTIAAALAACGFAAPAGAAVGHVVQPGETLWSIAAANNLTTRTVAAYNGLSENGQVVLGSTIQVPTTVEGYASLQSAGLVPASAPATTTASTGTTGTTGTTTGAAASGTAG